MSFEPTAFLRHFADYLKSERASTVSYLCAAVSSPEHWFKFEAVAWLNANREKVGLSGGSFIKPDWGVFSELRVPKRNRVDIWLQYRADTSDRCGVAIELKPVFNNGHFRTKIRSLRADLCHSRPLPDRFSNTNTSRYGVAVLVYVRYEPGSEGTYQILGGKRAPVAPEELLMRFNHDCGSTESFFGESPPIRVVDDVVQVVSLDGERYIDPNSRGCGVWLALCEPAERQSRSSLVHDE